MKAVRYHETGTPDVLRLEELPTPSPGPGEVLIRVEAAGVNFSDASRRRGEFYPLPTPLPRTTGGETVGIVEALGEGADKQLLGRRVFGLGDGGCAEFLAVPAARTYPVPEGLDPVQAVALFIQGLTAAGLLRWSAQIKTGDTLFFEGAAGGVGTLAIQLARLYGAGSIIGGASGEKKHALVRRLGADHAIEYRAPGWSAKVNELTNGRGVDFVFDKSGASGFEEALQCLAPCGRVVVFGTASGAPPRLEVERMFVKSQGVIAFLLATFFPDRARINATLEEFAGFIRADKLEVQIGGTFPLARTADAHRLLESGESTGKLVVVP